MEPSKGRKVFRDELAIVFGHIIIFRAFFNKPSISHIVPQM